jgi:hypothetical protein
MALYALFEADPGGSAILISQFVTRPADTLSIIEIDGVAISPAQDFDLLGTVTALNDLKANFGDFGQFQECMRSVVKDLGAGNEEDGIDYLIANNLTEALIALENGLGTPAQFSAQIPNADRQSAVQNIYSQALQAGYNVRCVLWRQQNTNVNNCNTDILLYGVLNVIVY